MLLVEKSRLNHRTGFDTSYFSDLRNFVGNLPADMREKVDLELMLILSWLRFKVLNLVLKLRRDFLFRCFVLFSMVRLRLLSIL